MNRFGRPLLTAVFWLLLLQSAATAAADRHTIWQVTSGKGTVYLVGSIHLLNEASYPLPRIYEEIYQKSQNLAFETDIDRLATPEIRRKMVQYGSLPQGQYLQSKLSDETYRQLERYFDQTGIPIERMVSLKPWLCAATVTVLELQKLGFSQGAGLDNHFHARAGRDAKIRLHLEGVDEHLAVLHGFDRFDNDMVIMQTLIDVENLSSNFNGMIDAWENGDIHELERLINAGTRDYPEMREMLITDRNRRWMPKIEKLLGLRQTGMVIVGAAHLVGADSLVELLGKKGYRVTQL